MPEQDRVEGNASTARRSPPRSEPPRRSAGSAEAWLRSSSALPQQDWVRAVQRLAGNRAVAAELSRWAVQREEPAAVPRPAPLSSPDGPGREPTRSEHADWDGAVPDAPWRILRPQESGYNCFAWAVGTMAFDITDKMVEPSGNSATLDKWTTYLAENYGFGRFADGLDAGADLIMYGYSPTQILHAARRADEPYQQLTFSSKLGGGSFYSPVILHAPDTLSSNAYGRALRSFWRGAAGPAQPEPTQPQPTPRP